MGRPPKLPDHPITRLRKAISTETPVTREMLAQRCGVPAPTIRDIETGRIKQLSESIAQKIMLATGVSTQSLLRGDDPLKDILGRELSAESRADMISEVYYQEEISMVDMLGAAIKAAKEKKRSTVFYKLFSEWLPQAISAIDATKEMKNVLNRRLGLFDTYYVPEAFQPTDPKIKKRWDQSWAELMKAIIERGGGIDVHDPTAHANAYVDELNSRRKAHEDEMLKSLSRRRGG
jgi:hypothetical protein